MQRLNPIAHSIYDVCFDVEKRISALAEVDARLWARANAMRHAHTIRAILHYVDKRNKKNLRILNASGLSCGHQDFSIVFFLRKNVSIPLEWEVFESPNSRFLTMGAFKKYVEDLQIRLRFVDFSKITQVYEEAEEPFDIVLFTEIAEHLDHSTLLRTLTAIRDKMEKGGILIITTPNLLRLENRIRFLFGKGDNSFWGDGTQNLERGLYGHIVNYDIKRLRRLLFDIGYKICQSYSFTPGRGSREKYLIQRLLFKLNDTASFFFRYSQATLFVVAEQAPAEKIPFQV